MSPTLRLAFLAIVAGLSLPSTPTSAHPAPLASMAPKKGSTSPSRAPTPVPTLPSGGASPVGGGKLPSQFPKNGPFPQPVPLPTPAKPTGPIAKPSPIFAPKLNDGTSSLRGFVDLHAHPMSHLGFGGHVLHGAPDVGIAMPIGSIYRNNDCNRSIERARDASVALGSCYSAHAGKDWIKNKCGNDIRRLVLNGLEDGNHTNKPHSVDHPQGFPNFSRIPKHDDILHQQMWVDWIERAYRGGMRVMVALAVNNYTLAHGIEASEGNPRTDKASGDLQIRELKRMVARHPWMEIAYSARDLRRIVGQRDKLAIVIGVELDDMGDFVVNKSKPAAAAVRSEIQRLHRQGVRYAFPVHLIDNYFAGTAVYEDELNRANCFHYGSWWKLRCTDGRGRDEFGIEHEVESGSDLFKLMKLGSCGGSAPVPKCGRGQGHMNREGLTALGREAISEMMRLGMIIDIDHTSLASLHGILSHTVTPAGKYPLVSGHNGMRPSKGGGGNENQRTRAQYIELAQRKGMAGVGWGALRSDEWMRKLLDVRATSVPLALGSDINGLVVQPSPRAGCSPSRPCVVYSDSFPRPTFGSKTWDYNRDGVAHIGLFPDLLKDIEGQGRGPEIVNALFDGAEAFAVTWENSERIGRSVPAPRTSGGIEVTSAMYGRNCGIPASRANITSWVSEQCAGESSCTYSFTWAPWGGDPSPSLCKKQIDIQYKCGSRSRRVEVMHERTPQSIRLDCR